MIERMESGVFLNCLDQFMLSPLVTWVKTLAPDDGGEHLDFSDLLDGVFLNNIMAQLNPPAAPQVVSKVCRDPSQRIQNLNFLVQQIKTYYLDHLRQLIAIPLPDVLLLGRTPYCEQSLDEMKKLLLLLLGCAVQCDKKEEYIEKIQTLDFDTKAAIAAHIQELTHSQENVLDLHQLESGDMHPEEMEAAVRTVATCLQHLLEQRDAHLEAIAELMQEKEAAGGSLCGPSSPLPAGYSPSMQQQQVGTQQHLVVELADSKAKIRRLRQELEERREQMLDCRHELENMEAQLKRIQQENSRLLVDARSARTYRDELDALRERAMKADKLESEVARYREQLHKMELYKAKVEELKEDNRVLVETKEVLEDQLEGWRARTDKIHQLEKHILLLKARVLDMEQEREVDRKCIKELQEENLALCLAQRRSMDESQHLGWELEQLSKTSESSQGQQTFSEEVTERTRSQLLKLEKENQSLLRTIEELSTKSKESSHQMCSSTDFNGSKQACCSVTENSEPLVNGGSNCHQDLSAEARTRPFDTADCCRLESRQLEDAGAGKDLQETMSDLEALENVHNGLHALDGSETPNGSRLHHDGIFTGLPARSSYANKHTQRLEAKVRALDAVNLQLQTSLDSSDRKVALLEEEVQELEAENQTLQTSLEELQISVRRLEQLESEKQSLEQETASLEKNKRHLEKENRRLRQQVEILEANLDNSNVCMSSLEREMRGVVKEVEGLRETAERVKNLEVDNRQLAKQAAIDQKTLATLRQELVNEKMSTQQRDAELRRRTHELEMRVLNQESAEQPEAHTSDGRVKMLELESSLKKSLQDTDDQILEARLKEASSFNQQLCHELKTVKLSCDALQQTQEEWSSSEAESCKAVSKWLQESQEATKELLRVKDHLIKVERNNATLEAEQQAVQVQLKQLEGQSHIQQVQILALQRQAASLQENNTALQTHNASLQVEMSTLNSQSAALTAQNAQLQQQQSRTESERDGVVRERDELRSSHEQLLRDHERLVVLHERQAMEYEALMGKHKCLKNTHRTLELEHRTLQDRCNSLLQQRTKLEDLERALKEEQMRIGLEKEQHQSTAAECSRLRDEKDWLNQVYCQLVKDNEALTADHKQLKTQMNEIKLEKTWLEADFSKLKTELQQLDITSMKLSNQCELLSQLKENLDEENRHLLSQIKTLMLQNRTLLEQNMESKDLFHVEERQYIDKLNDLRRQKEKLEEKIMDQYKLYEPSPPRRRGNWITLKLRKLMRSSSRELEPAGLAEPHVCSQESGSFISSDGSGGSASAALPQHSSKDSNASSLPSGCEDNDMVQNHGVQSRAQSESSGEFSLSLENEPWSNGSSPIQQPPSRRSSSSNQPPSDTSTHQWDMKLQGCSQRASPVSNHHSQNTDNQSVQTQLDPVPPQDFWLSRGTKTIRRGSRGKFPRRSSDLGAQTNSGLKRVGSKSETTQSSACSPITVLYVQGKSSSMSGCLNCFSAPLVKERPLKGPGAPGSLPRASNVISTAEGSSRRSSLSSRGTCRTGPQQVSTEEPQTPPGPAPPLKPPRDPTVLPSEHHKAPVQESLGSPFTLTSVFSNTIFSDAAANTNCLDGLRADQIFLSPNQTQTCPLQSQTSSESGSQALLGSERQQSENAAAQKDA
uniref:Coiled-coil domain containing 88Aa n=1 Tax=Oryzias latipes TaxID=8090 RepID=A0A3P9JUU9_ORYLA